jgi:predicted outer membrane repeat protein
MKTQGALALIGTLFISVFFGACSFPSDESQEQTAPGLVAREGHGLVKISLTLGDARTALPEIGVFASYTLQFIRTGETDPVLSETTPDPALTIELEAGTYTLVVTGYNSNDELLARGSAEVVVSENQETPVTVQLNATQMGSGTLSYTISVPETLVLETGILRLDPLLEGSTLVIDLSSGWEGTVVIPSGFYRAGCDLYGTIDTEAENKNAGQTMIVHIYDNVETKLEFTFGDDEFINEGWLPLWVAGDSGAFTAALTEIQNSAETNIDIYVNADFSLNPVSLSESGYSGKTITIRGTGMASHELNLNSTGALFTVGSNVTLVVENITFKGRTGNNSAVLHVDGGTVSLNTGAVISGNSNSTNGGGVYVGNNGIFTMQNSAVIQGNTASSNGGGVYVDTGTFTMQDSAVVSSNTASVGGGGVYVHSSGTFTMQDSAVVSGNTTSSNGGGVLVDGTFTMQDSAVVRGNTASVGGGVYVYSSGTFTMQDSAVVSGNTASSSGGGVYVQSSGTFTMQDSAVVSGNTASSYYGGGVYVYGTFTMQDSAVIQGNTASSYGGGVCVGSGGIFRKEPKEEGDTSGIIYGSDESDAKLKNTAATGGSAVYVDSLKQRETTAGETIHLSTDSSDNWDS